MFPFIEITILLLNVALSPGPIFFFLSNCSIIGRRALFIGASGVLAGFFLITTLVLLFFKQLRGHEFLSFLKLFCGGFLIILGIKRLLKLLKKESPSKKLYKQEECRAIAMQGFLLAAISPIEFMLLITISSLYIPPESNALFIFLIWLEKCVMDISYITIYCYLLSCNMAQTILKKYQNYFQFFSASIFIFFGITALLGAH